MRHNYMGYMGFDIFGFIEAIEKHNSERIRREKKALFGITTEGDHEGIPRLGIPHKYQFILIGENEYLSCHTFDSMDVYDKDGKFMFYAHGVQYLGDDMFLAGHRIKEDRIAYALYHRNEKLTEHIFREDRWNSTRFNEHGFAVIRYFEEWNKGAVVNKLGQILYSGGDYLSLMGVVCSDREKYINLLTGDVICEKRYSSDKSIEIKYTIFVEADKNCVFQINKATGEYIVHGEPPVKKEPKSEVPAKREVKKADPPKVSIGRNDDCPHCLEKGVKVKFKKCKEHFK